MTEENFKGLKIVPLNHSIHSTLRSTATSDQHPFRGLYLKRHPPPDHSTKVSHSVFVPPDQYKSDDQLIGPDPVSESPCEDKWQYFQENFVSEEQTVRLRDVEAFRNSTAEKVLRPDVNRNSIVGLSAGIARLSTSSSSIRPVIYRFVDHIKDSLAVLEAIHFELFMPDRSDLRFLAIQVSCFPSNTVEGDYFHLSDADLLSDSSFAIKLGKVEYPVFWEVKTFHKISSRDEQEGLAYMIKTARGGMIAVSDVVSEDLFIRQNIFPDGKSRNTVVRVTFKIMWSTAQIFPVEPVRTPHLKNEEKSKIIKSLSPADLENVYKAYSSCKSNPMNHDDTLEYLDSRTGDQLMRVLFKLGHSKVNPDSEYLKRIFGVHTSSQHMRGVVTQLRLLSAIEAHWIENRLGSFTKYRQTEDDLELMDQYFKLGSRFRNRAQAGLEEDGEDTKINESLVLKTLMEEGQSLENSRQLLDCIYGRNDSGVSERTANMDCSAVETVKYKDGTILQLNAAQSNAVRLYADKDGPRMFCVCSPPGSGKSTTAVAMAAKIARLNGGRSNGVQLLLSVQNVAVDNLGHLLKKVDFGKVDVEVYNMKTKILNPHVITPYDLFDSISKEELEEWMNEEAPVPNYDAHEKNMFTERQKALEKKITKRRHDFEKYVRPEIILATLEMAIHKKMNNSRLEERLSNVRGIIIDEASLLTEASLYAIIRRFPEARIVLIGDDRQLPPFQYDQYILGQELAGRCALSVAMKNGKMPIVDMNEVYKAPPSLIAPYNGLAYHNKLISRKAEEEGLLCKMGLIPDGHDQLLLYDVDGKEKTEMINKKEIVFNTVELEAVVSLLKKFPDEWMNDIMIICLYKGQKLKLDEMVNGKEKSKKYNVLTVDSAQGKEAPIVILLTTRTKATPFICNVNRCNVAVSRQQKALIIVGKSKFLIATEPWKTVLNNGNFYKN